MTGRNSEPAGSPSHSSPVPRTHGAHQSTCLRPACVCRQISADLSVLHTWSLTTGLCHWRALSAGLSRLGGRPAARCSGAPALSLHLPPGSTVSFSIGTWMAEMPPLQGQYAPVRICGLVCVWKLVLISLRCTPGGGSLPTLSIGHSDYATLVCVKQQLTWC